MPIRKIVKKRVGSDGVEIDCEQNSSRYVDIKESKKVWYERGRGFHYQKTIYNHSETSTRREYDDPEKITFKNPDDESQTIPYTKDKGDNHGTIKRLWIEAGRGIHYKKTRVTFLNDETNNTRRVRVQTVENETTGDTIDVERIERFSVDHGRGFAYQKKRVVPRSTEEEIERMDGDCKQVAE